MFGASSYRFVRSPLWRWRRVARPFLGRLPRRTHGALQVSVCCLSWPYPYPRPLCIGRDLQSDPATAAAPFLSDRDRVTWLCVETPRIDPPSSFPRQYFVRNYPVEFEEMIMADQGTRISFRAGTKETNKRQTSTSCST